MNELIKFMNDCADSYRSMMREMNLERAISPKKYGEYLSSKGKCRSKNKKRGKRR